MNEQALNQLIVNKLSREQYEALNNPSDSELYIIQEHFDNTPTQGSNHLVKSGPIATAIQNNANYINEVNNALTEELGDLNSVIEFVNVQEEDRNVVNALNILSNKIKALENIIDTLTIDPHPSDSGNVFYMDLPKVKTIYKGDSFTIDFGSYYNNEYVEPTIRINNIELNDDISSNYIEIIKYDSQYIIKGIEISPSTLTLEFYQKVEGNIVSNIYAMKLNINDPNITGESSSEPSAEPSAEPFPETPTSNPVTDPTTSEVTEEVSPTDDINPPSPVENNSENNTTSTESSQNDDTPQEENTTNSPDPSSEPEQNTLESVLSDYENGNI